MNFKELGKKIAGIGLPLVGTALGGGAGGKVASMITDALGLSSTATEDDIVEKLQNDPDALMELKRMEINQEIELRKLSVSEDEMYIKDTQDARAAQVQREKTTGKPDYNLYVLGWTIVIGFFVIVGVLMSASIPTGVDKILFMLLGTLQACFTGVVQYFFGSSKSSSDKTKLLTEGK